MEWRKNLYQYEETPPNDNWEKINQELDSDVPKIREALFDYAEQPPAISWEKIAAKLDQPVTNNRYRRPLIWAAAAAAVVAGLFFFSDFFDANKKPFQSPDISASVYYPSPSGSNDSPRAGATVLQPVKFDPNDENYIYLTTSSGELKRLSYKFEDMIPELKKQDGEMIRKWKAKLEASSFIPAGNNFFDIAEMIQILQEGEKR